MEVAPPIFRQIPRLSTCDDRCPDHEVLRNHDRRLTKSSRWSLRVDVDGTHHARDAPATSDIPCTQKAPGRDP